ncbi:hypothetical protein PSY57_23525, partial [Shigella flexneri]|nr:hypothetical protein [Shigella flexneri]
CSSFMHRNFFDHVDIPAENINLLNGIDIRGIAVEKVDVFCWNINVIEEITVHKAVVALCTVISSITLIFQQKTSTFSTA